MAQARAEAGPERPWWARSVWDGVRDVAGSQQVRTASLVAGAAAGAVAAVALIPVATTAGVVGAVVGGGVLGGTLLNSARVGLAGDRNRAESDLIRDAVLVTSGSLGAVAAVVGLPAVGIFAGGGGLALKAGLGATAASGVMDGLTSGIRGDPAPPEPPRMTSRERVPSDVGTDLLGVPAPREPTPSHHRSLYAVVAREARREAHRPSSGRSSSPPVRLEEVPESPGWAAANTDPDEVVGRHQEVPSFAGLDGSMP